MGGVETGKLSTKLAWRWQVGMLVVNKTEGIA